MITDIRHLGTIVELDLAGLESDSTYKVFRDTTLPLSGSKMQVGSDISGMISDTVTDSSPPAGKAFYQIEKQ